MKKIKSPLYGCGCWKYLFLLLVSALSFQDLPAQVRVPFTQRTSSYTPDTKIYNIKGDFQMIGNTNLTLENYTATGSNNANMEYVDVDNDPNTLNSSSATLALSTEGGIADPNCSSIIYAGLYWTGRAHNGYSPNIFPVGGSTDGRTNGNSFNGYTLSITSTSYTPGGNTSQGTIATYIFTPSGGGSIITFRFYSWRDGTSGSTYNGTVTVQVGAGPVTSLSGGITNNSSDNLTFTLSATYTINTGSQTIYINSLRKRRTDTSINTNYLASVTYNPTKLFNKRQVKFKKAGGTYQTVTANASDIYYPTDGDGYMYSAYAEVTDYVKANKTGEYFVADIALQEGNGGSTGYYGGWGLIVVYENSKMKWRDVTIFDGHAYVASGAGNQTLPISGFNTVQTGPVGVKLGLIAGEGDVSISGDKFSIRNAADSAWVDLSHGGNSSTNFFNSSIYTGGNARNPDLVNNTGLDISMFTLPNSDKSLMTNNQTSTSFQYNSTQDTYIIFCIAMAVDAYIPEVQSENHVIYINDQPFIPGISSTTVYPNDEIQYTVELTNQGTEAVTDGKIVIPVPFTTTYISASAEYLWTGTPGMSGSVTYDPSLGGTGSIVWDIGYIPLPANKDEVLATLTYRLKVTNDCFILNNAACITVSVDGTTTGTGATSGVSFTNNKFVTGFIENGTCSGEPIYVPVNFNINAADYLATECTVPEGEDPDYYTRRKFKYCGLSAGGTIPFSDVSPNFPKGSRFYNKVNKDDVTGIVTPTDDAVQYTSASGFPVGTFGEPATYYAIPPGSDITCHWEFIIIVDQYCGNYWYGTEDNDWSKENNWTAKTVPGSGQNIEFATAANNKNQPAIRDLYLDTDRIIGDLINASDKDLLVTTGNQLTINGEVKDDNSAAGTIVVKAAKDAPSGTLIFADPENNKNVHAKAEFYNKAYQCADCGFYKNSWQYFGIPVKSSVFPYENQSVTIHQWSEPTNGNKWITPVSPLTAFTGYEMTDALTTEPTHIYTFEGTLNVGDATVGLTKTTNVNYSGINLIGNSYAAAIPISSAAIQFSSWAGNSTVYLFNAGTRDQWHKLNGSTITDTQAGLYTAVPLNVAGEGGLPDRIPSMHTFLVDAAAASDLTIKYDQLTSNELISAGVSMRSASVEPTEKLPYIVMDVIGESSVDRVWLFENKATTAGFDNGWDGYKIKENGIVQVYVNGEGDERYQVATVPQLQGVTFGLSTDKGESYTLDFAVTSGVEARNLYLKDLLTNQRYAIRNGAEYTVTGGGTLQKDRFKVETGAPVSNEKLAAPGVDVYVANNVITIANHSEEDCTVSVYNVLGKLVATQSVSRGDSGTIGASARLAQGVYIVKVRGGKLLSDTKRVILK